jgi:hypothetical protein
MTPLAHGTRQRSNSGARRLFSTCWTRTSSTLPAFANRGDVLIIHQVSRHQHESRHDHHHHHHVIIRLGVRGRSLRRRWCIGHVSQASCGCTWVEACAWMRSVLVSGSAAPVEPERNKREGG